MTIELVSVVATTPATWARAFSQASVASQICRIGVVAAGDGEPRAGGGAHRLAVQQPPVHEEPRPGRLRHDEPDPPGVEGVQVGRLAAEHVDVGGPERRRTAGDGGRRGRAEDGERAHGGEELSHGSRSLTAPAIAAGVQLCGLNT